jgi:hypothetical protein
MIARSKGVAERASELNPEALQADGFDAALVGYTVGMRTVLVYDADQCVDVLTDSGMTEEEAVEWMEYNTLGAYVGPDGPLFVRFG